MVNPFADGSIVMEGTTSSPTEYVQFEPDGLPGEFWLQRRDEFDPTVGWDEIVDQYALPPSEEYTVRIVAVPADVDIRFGSVGANHGRSGGGDLVDPIDYDSIPSSWIRETTTLTDLLDA
jgi:hypothetical protein